MDGIYHTVTAVGYTFYDGSILRRGLNLLGDISFKMQS